jgi:3-isopropylmalate/(R)-2-methylmalate dehydratase small subunit
MDKFTTWTGQVMPLDRSNVDTDAIIPKLFIKSMRRTGFGPNLLNERPDTRSG